MDYNGKIEVISCIACKKQVRKVLAAGADAIYAGLKNRSWYNSKIELSWEDFIECSHLVHSYGKKLYAAINRDLSSDDVEEILYYAPIFKNKTIDALIVSDWGCIEALRRVSKDIEIHLSANTACMNPSDFELAKELGVQRIVFSSTVKIEEMQRIIDHYNGDFQWEAVAYGGLCCSEVGYCPCQVRVHGRFYIYSDTCRRKYLLIDKMNDEADPGKQGLRSYALPLSRGEIAEDLYKAGVYHWKLEGRAKGINHILTGTRTLKKLAYKVEEQITEDGGAVVSEPVSQYASESVGWR